MTPRGAAIQGGLALSGLLLAFATWQREPEREGGEVVMVEATKGDLQKVRFEDGVKWVELLRESGSLWLHTSARGAENGAQKAPERTVRASESGEKFFERFAPLRATRSLGVLPEDKLKEVGLGQPKKKLVVAARGDAHSFLVGDSPFGVSDPYVKDERGGTVYVLGGMLLSDLESAASRFVDRALHELEARDVDTITVSAGGKKRVFQATAGEGGLVFGKLMPVGGPDKPDEQAKLWHDKVWRLVVTEVLGRGEKPERGEPTIALRVDYARGGKDRGFVELGRLDPAPAPTTAVPDGGTPPPSPPPEIYARSERTASWVRVAQSADDA